jgi:hypothetical protein
MNQRASGFSLGLESFFVSGAKRHPASVPGGIAPRGQTGKFPVVANGTDLDNFSGFVLHPNCLFLGFSCLNETLEAREPARTRIPWILSRDSIKLGAATDGPWA